MKLLAASAVMMSMLAPAAYADVEEKMKIQRSGSQPSQAGPEAYFSGQVRIDAPFQGREPARVGVRPSPSNRARVLPGTLTHWVKR